MSKVKISRAKWSAPPRSLRRYLPSDYFLMPSARKYPYREWKGKNKGAINCNALKVAIPRAALAKDKAIKEKARRLYNKYCRIKRKGGKRR